mmetsp:Transcript_5272/g.17428  ORF Transcript_5272/g.17428 Transcript_5272/m.17428 type:complete len:211 (-) Transcript_5272:119-751(-)
MAATLPLDSKRAAAAGCASSALRSARRSSASLRAAAALSCLLSRSACASARLVCSTCSASSSTPRRVEPTGCPRMRPPAAAPRGAAAWRPLAGDRGCEAEAGLRRIATATLAVPVAVRRVAAGRAPAMTAGTSVILNGGLGSAPVRAAPVPGVPASPISEVGWSWVAPRASRLRRCRSAMTSSGLSSACGSNRSVPLAHCGSSSSEMGCS